MPKHPILIVIILFILSYISDKVRLEFTPVSNIIVLDNGNNNDGSDIEINFDKQLSPKGIEEYRVFLIPSSLSTRFDIEAAEELNSELYTAARYSDVFPIQGIKLDSSSRSIDGALISDRIKYDVAVMTIVYEAEEFNNSFTFEANDFELTNNSQIRTFITFPDTVGAGTITIDQEGSLYIPTVNILDKINAGFLNYSDLYRITKTASRSIIVDRI